MRKHDIYLRKMFWECTDREAEQTSIELNVLGVLVFGIFMLTLPTIWGIMQ